MAVKGALWLAKPLSLNLNFSFLNRISLLLIQVVDPGGPVVIILPSGSEVRGFDPGRGRWIFSERKNPMTSFGREVKPWVPCRIFTARKRTSSRNKSLLAKFVGLFTLYVGSEVDHLRC